MCARGKGCKNVTQHNTEDTAICDPSIRVLGRLLSARKIRLSGISSASPLGVAPRESYAYRTGWLPRVNGYEKRSGNIRRKNFFLVLNPTWKKRVREREIEREISIAHKHPIIKNIYRSMR